MTMPDPVPVTDAPSQSEAARAWTEVERYVSGTLGRDVNMDDDISLSLHVLSQFIARPHYPAVVDDICGVCGNVLTRKPPSPGGLDLWEPCTHPAVGDERRLRDVVIRVERVTAEAWYGTRLSGKAEALVRTIRGILGGVRDLIEEPICDGCDSDLHGHVALRGWEDMDPSA